MAENNEEQRVKITFDTNAQKAAQDTNALGASIEHTTDATEENTNAQNKNNESFKNFKTQLREANEELQKQIQLTGESSQETIKAAKAVAELKDQMGFAKDLADTFNPDQKMKALGAATQVAGTGLQGVTAGMALFGGESEDTQKQLLKVQAAMAFSDAISNLSNLGDQWKLLKNSIAASSIATKANAAATGVAAMVQNIFTGSVTTTTAGFKALKFAIAATGIGLLVVGLVSVYQNFDKISKFMTILIPGLAGVGKFIGNIVESITDFVGVTSEADRTIDRIKKNADSSLALNKKFLAEHGSQLDEFTKQKIAAKDKYNEAVKEDGADQIALAKELNRELAAIEHSRGDDARKIQKENAEKAADEAQKRREEQREKNKEAAEKEKKDAEDLAKSNFEAEQETIKSIDEADKKRYEDLKQTKEERLEQEGKDNLIQLEAYAKTKDDEKKADEAAEKAKEDNKNRLISMGESLIAGVKNLAGKNKAIQKAAIIADGGVSIGKAVANTSEAVTKDLAKGAPFSAPLVALDIAVGATSVASIIKGTSDALKAVGGGGSIPNNGATGQIRSAAPPSVAFNNSAENQIGQSVSRTQANQPPLQVTVLESDITKAQNNVNVLVNKNKF